MELQRQVHRLHLRRIAHHAGHAGNLPLQQRPGEPSRRRRRSGGPERARRDGAATNCSVGAVFAMHHVERSIPELDADGFAAAPRPPPPPNSSFSRYSRNTPRRRSPGARTTTGRIAASNLQVSREDLGAAVNDQHALHRRLRHEGRRRHEARDDGRPRGDIREREAGSASEGQLRHELDLAR